MKVDFSPVTSARNAERGYKSYRVSHSSGAYRQTSPLHCIVPIAEGATFQIICNRIAHRMVKVPRALNGYCELHYDEAVAALKPIYDRFLARTAAYRDGELLHRVWEEGNLGARGHSVGAYKQVRRNSTF